MPSQHEVTCIEKSDRYNPHERILSIGGTKNSEARWKITQHEAIGGIESGQWQFYVTVAGKTVLLVVSTSAQGHKYLTTQSDGEQPDNLLSLAECP